MTNVPDKIRSNVLRLNVNVHRFEAGLTRDVTDLLKELGRDLIKELIGAGLDTPRTEWQRKRMEDLLKEAKRQIKSAYGTIADTVDSEIRGLVQVSGKGLATAINDALGADLMLPPRFTKEQLNAIASDVLIQGAPSAEWWSRQSDDLKQAFADTIRQGMLKGEPIDRLRDRIMGQNIPGVNATGKVDLRKVPKMDRGPIWKARRNAEALVRTSVITANNAAHEALFEANSDLMAGLVWVSTLDFRTCPSCGALDGMEWEPGESHPSPSLHFGCRCSIIMRTKTWEQLAREAHGNSRIAKELDKMPEGNRASMGGPVSGKLTYEDWFSGLSEKEQVSAIGKGKQALWSQGKIGFADMIDQSGNSLTLKELEAMYS